MAEHRTHNPKVVGSSPTPATNRPDWSGIFEDVCIAVSLILMVLAAILVERQGQ